MTQPDTAAFVPPKVIGHLWACAFCNCYHLCGETHFERGVVRRETVTVPHA